MCSTEHLVKEFTERAVKAGAVVSEVKSMDEAFAYTVDLCEKKDKCQLLLSSDDTAKLIAAPALPEGGTDALAKLCEGKGIEVITSGMRKHLAGIDCGVTVADFGVADSGTLVQNSCSEELRLATMVSENHVAILPKSRLRENTYEVEKEFVELVDNSPSYMAFITGPSRTADIERVLALGVHGPLELHILLLEDN